MIWIDKETGELVLVNSISNDYHMVRLSGGWVTLLELKEEYEFVGWL